ncbi:MAG: hypothetical protein ACXVAX_06680 [Pseudobdellovibrio sp.]
MSKVEVYLDEQQIKSLKSILTQSEHGIHVLFENTLIAEVFKNEYSEEEFFEIENIKNIQDDLLKLLQFKTLIEKKSYINSLKEDEKHRIVRAYFYIIENNLRTSQKLPH